ncbi:DUF6049 family protein [Saccharomonospora viridis]|uniref:DUF6049 family protein n=1 Tax=Saccharomonospora viridis TaxID=1852 RepID=UPI0023EFF898|nr:DUF6049 family protein [Saccharomonospora viridis]
MKKLSAFGLALLFLAAQALFAGSVTPSASAQSSDPRTLLQVRIEHMTPRVVSAGDTELRITAEVTNVGDRPITNIVAAVQVGPRQTTSAQLAQTLVEPPPATAGESAWVGVSDRLDKGASAQLSITAPLAQLGLHEPGVYPLLLNINGTPAYGGTARLAAVDLLLPVLGGSGSARGGAPTAVSMLWPFAAREPKVVSVSHDRGAVLSDDELAGELAPGGRLHSLVSAAESQRGNAALFDSLCFAVDPDLLETVDAMSKGYRVRTESGIVEGKGREHAERWLADLRALVANHCVVELPYAGADLGALTQIPSEIDLVNEAVTNDATILHLLNITPRSGVLWPGGGLSPAALQEAADAGVTTVITAPTAVENQGARLVTYDPLVRAGFALASTRGSGAARATEQPEVATQSAVAAVALRAGLGGEATEHPVLVAPPHEWNVSHTELTNMLDSLGRLQEAGLVNPTSLDEVLSTVGPETPGDTGTSGTPQASNPGSSTSLPDDVLETLSDVESTAADLQSAMSVDPTRQVEPISLIQPLHKAVIRATSQAWRDDGDYRIAAKVAQRQVRQLSSKITVSTPSQPVSLASASSPLPVTLSNDLPVAVTVRIKFDNSPGLRPSKIEDTPLAANSRVSRLIPAETLRAGRFIVNVSLSTPGGTTLGQTSRMELTSSEFGVVTVVLTATAGAALVLLSGRRIYRRMKTQREERG